MLTHSSGLLCELNLYIYSETCCDDVVDGACYKLLVISWDSLVFVFVFVVKKNTNILKRQKKAMLTHISAFYNYCLHS